MDIGLTDTQFYPNLILTLGAPAYHLLGGAGGSRKSIVVLGILFLCWLLWLIALGFNNHIHFRDAWFAVVAYGSILFVLLSEILVGGGAEWLTRKRGEKWTKEIDYIYLALGAVGLILSVGQLQIVSDKPSLLPTIGPGVLVTALVLRLIKTRAEIAGWNKLPKPIQT